MKGTDESSRTGATGLGPGLAADEKTPRNVVIARGEFRWLNSRDGGGSKSVKMKAARLGGWPTLYIWFKNSVWPAAREFFEFQFFTANIRGEPFLRSTLDMRLRKQVSSAVQGQPGFGSKPKSAAADGTDIHTEIRCTSKLGTQTTEVHDSA